MTAVLLSSFLLLLWFSARALAEIHNLLRELDSSDHGDHGRPLQDNMNKLDEYRKTVIKEEILSRLGLSSPPNISGSPPVPKEIIENVLLQSSQEDEQISQDTDAYYGVTKQFVLMALPDEPRNEIDSPEAEILRFHTNFPRRSIASVFLGFYRDPRVLSRYLLKKNGNLLFRVLHDGSNSKTRPVHIIRVDNNWVILNLSHIDFGRDDNQVRNISLQLICDSCGNRKFLWNSENYRPFLVINVKQSKKKRVTRSVMCNGDKKNCCLQKYVVKFSDLGWDKWILAPDRIFFNYCKGSCRRANVLNTMTQHEGFKILLATKRIIQKSDYTEPCCVVTKMTGVSVIYKTGEGPYNIAKKDLPNMRAMECGCS